MPANMTGQGNFDDREHETGVPNHVLALCSLIDFQRDWTYGNGLGGR